MVENQARVSMLPNVQTPSEEAVAKVIATHDIIDSQGRRLTLKKPALLTKLRLMETVGAETSMNPAYMAIVTGILHVIAIDRDPVLPPRTKSEIEFLIQRFEEEDLELIANCINEHWPQKDPNRERADLKK